MIFKPQLAALLVTLWACAAAADRAPDGGAGDEGRWIVELESPSLAAAAAESPDDFPRLAGGRFDLESDEVRAHLAALDQEHAELALALAMTCPGAAIERSFAVLFNGVVVDGASAEALLALPGVVRAVPADTVRAALASGDPMDAIDVDVLWDAAGGEAGAGERVRVAVIDSGIDPGNAMFDPSGFPTPPGFPRGDTRFTTGKVIAARAYFRPADPVDPAIDSADPADHLGHGSRCAGVAAGASGVAFDLDGTMMEVGGVAPRAYLMSYKAFYAAASGDTAASDAELMAAFEDAVLDGADVIECAWGGPPPMLADTPLEVAIRAASGAGAVVVFAAGNEGSGPDTISFPGTIPEGLTVGSFSTGRVFAGIAAVVGPDPVPSALREMPAVRGTISPSFEGAPVGPAPLVSAKAAVGAAAALACDPLPDLAFEGAVALVERGTCPFSTKVANAEAAGAIAVIVYNDVPGAQPVTMGGDAVAIPAVQIGNPDGAMLEAFAAHAAGCEVTVVDTLAPYVRADQAWGVAGASGRGPTDAPLLKPEIAAPGESIVSANAAPVGGAGAPWSIASGTSMAASFAAGAAAVLRRLHPALDPGEVIAALASGASEEHGATAGGAILDRGAGFLDFEGAGEPLLYAAPPAVSFGEGRAGETLTAALGLGGEAGGPPITIAWEHADPAHAPIVTPGDGEQVAVGDVLDLEAEIPLATPGGEYTGYLSLSVGAGPGQRELRVPYHYRVVPPVRRDLLLVDLSFLGAGHDELISVYRALAEEAGLDADVFRVDDADGPPPLALLEGYDVVLVLTGDDQTGHLGALGARTLDAASTYLARGGRVIVAGQGALRGSTHARLFGLLGARIADTYPLFDPYTLGVAELDDYAARVSPDLFPSDAVPADPAIDLAPDNGGFGDLEFAGEIADVTGPGLPTALTRPVIFMDDPVFAGGVGALGAVFDPYPAYGAFPEVEALGQRAALLGFGLERVADEGAPLGSLDLFEALYAWITAGIDVDIEVETVDLHVIVDAQTSGGDLQELVYDFGDGSEPLVTDEPRAYWEYAEPGDYEVTVVARSTLGAADVERVDVTVPDDEPPSTDTGEDTGSDGGGFAPDPVPGRGVRDCGCAAPGARAEPRGSILSILAG